MNFVVDKLNHNKIILMAQRKKIIDCILGWPSNLQFIPDLITHIVLTLLQSTLKLFII